MGRIKTSYVKRVGREIFEQHKDDFTTDFTKNKDFLKKNYEVDSYKLKNVVAGYITKLKKQSQRI